jgi:ElaB/YqjD/DUF883 family membrane-anchored ribosome-binding protein
MVADADLSPDRKSRNFRRSAVERGRACMVELAKEEHMAQQDRNLPEGTDSIIPGAMETGTSEGSGTTKTASASRSRSSGTGSGSQSGNGLMDKVRSEGGKLTDQASGKAREFVGQGLERSSDTLSNIGRLVGDTASGLDERLGAEYGDYARRASEAIDRTAKSLRTKDPDELIDDTRDFVRKSPAMALAGAAIVGFALARLIKSGVSASGDDDDGDSNSGSRRS